MPRPPDDNTTDDPDGFTASEGKPGMQPRKRIRGPEAQTRDVQTRGHSIQETPSALTPFNPMEVH